MEQSGYLKIYYGDESGFSLEPTIPYGWQPKHEYIKIVPKKGQRLNVFGLLSKDNDLLTYSTKGTINSSFIIKAIDEFAETIIGRSAIVIDNASIHHSSEFKNKIKEWEEKDVHIFYLPAYSPHLNIIETLWRMIKYKWLKPEDYLDFNALTDAVEKILLDVGENLKINFTESKYFTKYKLSII